MCLYSRVALWTLNIMKQCRGASRQQCRWFPLLIERFFSPSSRQRLTTSYRCGKQVFISVLSPLPSILPSHKYVITIIQHPAIQIPITFCHSSTVATRFEDKSANVDRVYLQGRYWLLGPGLSISKVIHTLLPLLLWLWQLCGTMWSWSTKTRKVEL